MFINILLNILLQFIAKPSNNVISFKDATAPHIRSYGEIHYLEILECIFLYVKFMTEVACDLRCTF